MTTTAVRTPHEVARRAGTVMDEKFRVAPRCGDDPPLPEDANKVGVMRRITAARLRHCGLEALADDVMVLVSEMLTNALVHSGASEIGLHITVSEGYLRITVVDGMAGAPVPKAVGENDESGRGLGLVETLVKAHGGEWDTSESGDRTWCSLALPAVQR
ncbi:ATP-binding protein [Streptomyces fructofermentans]|uniref:ATP-binding protein n=1 Tax=Streptomyces fructofermentans TaxID=152141 RepID=UPI0033FCAEFF